MKGLRPNNSLRVCLVTSTHVSANPRLVKEADALCDAGYAVHVVAADVNVRLRELDGGILLRAHWDYTLVGRGLWISYALMTVFQRMARLVLRYRFSGKLSVARIAHHRLTGRLTNITKRVSADLYIAHNLAALPAAAAAALANGANLGFDAEDFHTEELNHYQRNGGDQVARELIERRLLPRCRHLTGASPLIAEAYNDRYGVRMEPILNVFPLSEAPEEEPGMSLELVPRSLYWFSQTVGAGRGLEPLLKAMSGMVEPPILYLRGNITESIVRQSGDSPRTSI